MTQDTKPTSSKHWSPKHQDGFSFTSHRAQNPRAVQQRAVGRARAGGLPCQQQGEGLRQTPTGEDTGPAGSFLGPGTGGGKS